MSHLHAAREKLAMRILEDFKGKITGDCSDVCVGENPEDRYFVGKLFPLGQSQTASFSSDERIESVGADFYVSEEELERASIQILPRGDFYYRAYPTLEQQREAFLAEVNGSRGTYYGDFDALLEAYGEQPSEFERIRIKLVPVYKKVSLCRPGNVLSFRLGELLVKETGYGVADEQHAENRKLDQLLDELQKDLMCAQDSYKLEILEKTRLKDLLSEGAYRAFLERSVKDAPPIHQNWRVYVDVRLRKRKDRYLVSAALVNASMVPEPASGMRADDKTTIETLFNAGLEIRLSDAAFQPIKMDYFADDYRYNSTQKAVGSNCSVRYDEAANAIITEHLPTYTQKRLLTNDALKVEYQSLIDEPVDELNHILREMEKELKARREYRAEKSPSLSETARENLRREVDEFAREVDRFRFGIEVISHYEAVRKSFVLMNRAFLAAARGYHTWRLFQIVYIVSLIPDIAACEENLLVEEDKERATLEQVSLLYFPTGGGKTEAFLGVLIFNMFFDRFRGKEFGVTAILRYPLRLLSVQQVQRLANYMAQAELLRRRERVIADTEEFSLGYFVGDNNTHNQIREGDVRRYRSKTQPELDAERILDVCPFCGNPSVHIRFDEERYRLVHYCDHDGCPSGDALPVYIVDQEIYRYLPTAIISTVDKLSIAGNNPSFRNILNGAPCRCPKHGCTSTRKCLVGPQFCGVDVSEFEEIEIHDPAPTLFIQDELHLIRESLGTYASHYETFFDYCAREISPSHRPIKVIGATATISSYETQISQLYGRDPVRFPCASPYPDRNFYSYIDPDDTQRLILGYAPYGKAILNCVVYSLKYMREVVYGYVREPRSVLEIPGIGLKNEEEALEILKDYWIFLEYNNIKRDGNNVEGALETPVNVELGKQGVPKFQIRRMTGDETFQDVREVLAQVEHNDDVFHGVNLIAATSMISHGVDADRFNIMFFFGIPGNTAEYIQAYSRTGRKYTGIVVDIIRPTRETDRSYLNHFTQFHEFKDILVEPVPINRWATKAVDATLPGIFTGLLFNRYDPQLQYTIGSLSEMKHIRKAIELGELDADTIKTELKTAYGCLSDGYIYEMGSQYAARIDRFVEDVFTKILTWNWDKERVGDGFARMGYRIMNSLRSTDEQLLIELV